MQHFKGFSIQHSLLHSDVNRKDIFTDQIYTSKAFLKLKKKKKDFGIIFRQTVYYNT